jgi:hypothetical protein
MRVAIARIGIAMFALVATCVLATWPGERSAPAAVAPKKPPFDAGSDGPIPLPPVPDAQIPALRDAGTPMQP